MKEKYKFLLLGLLLLPCWGIALRFHVDLDTLYHTAKLLPADIARIYEYNGGMGRYFYGPVSLVLIEPLGKLPFVWVHVLWTFLQTVSYGLLWLCLYRLYPFLREPGTRWAWIAVWLLSINPIHNNFQSGNIQLMLAVLLLGSAVFIEEKPARPALAGFASAFAAAIKVFPLFIVAYHWFTTPHGFRRGVVAALAVCVALPFLVYGIPGGVGLFRGFVAGLFSYAADNSLTKTPDILCLPSFLARWLSSGVEPDAGTKWVIKGAIATFSAAFFALVLWRSKANGGFQERERLHLWSLGLALMVFLNPSTRPHYFIFLVPAMASAFELAATLRSAAERHAFTVASTTALLLIAFTAEGVVGKSRNDHWELLGVPTVGMFLLCATLLWVLSRSYGYVGQAFGIATARHKLATAP